MMAVGNEKILEKMMMEVQQAKLLQNDHHAMLAHIQHIRLLCDLFLDDEETPEKPKRKPNDIEEVEMKAMLGEKAYEIEKKKQQNKNAEIDHDGANGSSIFDF